MEEEKDLDSMVGEDLGGVAPKFILPLVRLNGKTGKYHLLNPEKSEEEELEESIQGVFLKARRVFSAFERDRKGEITRYFTNEHNNWKERINLFIVESGNNKAKFLDSGTSGELKEKYPNLKMSQLLYTYLPKEDKIVKLTIKGASLANWFTFRNETKSQNVRLYKYLIEMSSEKQESPLGPYYAMTLSLKEEISGEEKDKVEKMIVDTYNKIKEIDEYYAEWKPAEEDLAKTEESEVEEPEIVKEEIPTVEKEEPVIEESILDDFPQ